MRIEASKVLAQYTRERLPEPTSAEDYVNEGYGREHKLAEIEAAALDFAERFLLDFDMPSVPYLRFTRAKGLEDPHKAFVESVGVFLIHAEFRSDSNHTVRMELAIPMYRGEFQKPTVAYYHDKARVFSQDLIDEILSSIETNRFNVSKQFTPQYEVMRTDNIERQIFSAPNDPSGWNLLVTERY